MIGVMVIDEVMMIGEEDMQAMMIGEDMAIEEEATKGVMMRGGPADGLHGTMMGGTNIKVQGE